MDGIEEINMVYLTETIIQKVKEAESEQEVMAIIDACISGLKIKSENGRIDRRYTRNILMALKYHKTKRLEPQALDNIIIAIGIFKKLHAKGTENVL